jgi:acetate---CoA ligase (ADP-forming) subunit beta
MLTKEMKEIMDASAPAGWVLEPEAKRLFSLTGMDVPRFLWARTLKEGLLFADEVGYPVVAKVVSPRVIHKSEEGGVDARGADAESLARVFERFSRIEGFSGMLVEERVSGVEIIFGAKVDDQFGPVVLIGMGGTGVEIYRDVALRMAPLTKEDVDAMLGSLKGNRLLEGFRGAAGVSLEALTRSLLTFSGLVMDLEDRIESIDLNPVICSADRCVVADARIILKKKPE